MQEVVGAVAVQVWVDWPVAAAVTVYDSRGACPFSAGAVHDTVTCRVPATAAGEVGAGGGPGVATFDGADWSPAPAALFAVTTNW